MADENIITIYNTNTISTDSNHNPFATKLRQAQHLRGGAIFEVTNLNQAKLAQQAGASAIVVTDPQTHGGGVTRMPDPSVVKEIKRGVSIPVMAKARVGHFVEAQILEAVGVDYVDESEVMSLADDQHHINKHKFGVPFVCGSNGLGEALRRVREGAALIRTEGYGAAGSGNIAATVKSVRSVMGDIRILTNMDNDEVFTYAKKIQAPYDLVAQTKQLGRIPVVHFAAGGIVTPADAALMMQLGCDGVFIGSEIFESPNPYKRVQAMVQAVMNYTDPRALVDLCYGLDEAMAGLNLSEDLNLNEDQIESSGN
ncbi:hypothetical protein GIB67_011122 [Kingdonia uniflora]|uniref:PdxS/SNZ N-terminal domain-containing protein n=1 Tax=Kingdonia uniflora TaxID=39325 RepID=A0A7J7PAE6_9MAGN|nr:hypothetical protein GIB67_011122 [Kingdonia uniflora]